MTFAALLALASSPAGLAVIGGVSAAAAAYLRYRSGAKPQPQAPIAPLPKKPE